MKKALLLLTAILLSLASYSQNKVDQMNSIKKSKAYLYASMVQQTKGQALHTAYEQLEKKIMEYANAHSKKKVTKVIGSNINHFIDTIFIDRVEYVEAFVYVKKKDIIPIYAEQDVIIVDPDAENIIIEDKTMANKAKEETTDSKKEKKEETAETKPKADSEKKDLAEAKPKTEVEDADTVALDTAIVEELSPKAERALNKIKSADSFFDLQRIMEPMKQEGTITAYGKYSSMESPEECYLIVYDPAGNIRAVLGKGTDERPNLLTNKQDSETNYRGCGAIWFKLKGNA